MHQRFSYCSTLSWVSYKFPLFITNHSALAMSCLLLNQGNLQALIKWGKFCYIKHATQNYTINDQTEESSIEIIPSGVPRMFWPKIMFTSFSKDGTPIIQSKQDRLWLKYKSTTGLWDRVKSPSEAPSLGVLSVTNLKQWKHKQDVSMSHHWGNGDGVWAHKVNWKGL